MTIPTYRDRVLSGLPMVGDVPRHWRKTALKYLGEYQNGYPFKPEDWGDVGLPIVRIAQLSSQREPNYFDGTLDEGVRIKDGDLLFSWSATIDSFIWTGGDAWLNQHIFKVKASEEAEKAFLFYVIKHVAPKLADFDAHGSTMRHIKKESLGERLFVPDRPEQLAIATFLDRETAKIDALVEEQKRLIALLKEKRQAVISQAVTKGLDPNIPMKDSGMEWLGKVPVHWEVRAFKWDIDRNDGGVWGDEPDGVGDTIVLRSTEQTVDGHWRIDDPAPRKLSNTERTAALLAEGDLVVTKSSGSSLHIGKTTIVTPEMAAAGYCYSNFMQRIRTRASIFPKLAWYVMNSNVVRLQFDLASKSTTGLANLNGSIIGGIVIPVPPVVEQHRIVARMDCDTAKIDALVAQAERAIQLLLERRSALISAAVTGKIDVRGLAPQPESAAA
jgi:type I restriction enzyme S subunit